MGFLDLLTGIKNIMAWTHEHKVNMLKIAKSNITSLEIYPAWHLNAHAK